MPARPRPFLRLACLALAPLFGACTILEVDVASHGPRLKAVGLVDGYVSGGIPARDALLRIEVLSGRSPGALARVSLWPLVRAEVGLLGVNLGVLGVDAGLGVLFYEPRPPRYREPEEAGPRHERAGRDGAEASGAGEDAEAGAE